MNISNTVFEYKVLSIISMYDGDTVNVLCLREHEVPEQTIDFGFGDVVKIPAYTITKEIPIKVRMYGFDTPELNDKRPEWKRAANLARREARAWMISTLKHGHLIMITHKDKTGKYGRYLANFEARRNEFVPRRAEQYIMEGTLKDYLIEQRLAVPYHGQSKDEIEPAHAENIKYLKENKLI